jgi:hypothetical protein
MPRCFYPDETFRALKRAIAGFSRARKDACCIVAGPLPAIHQAQPLICPQVGGLYLKCLCNYLYFGHSLPRALLEFLVLITNLQIGYASGVLRF